jgi:cobalt-zinc-cadmium resistance protein CzcA
LRPCLMTTLVAMIGLFPAAISNGIGAQTQKPLAIVVIGGSMMLAVVARMVQPPLLVVAHTWIEKFGGRHGGGGSHGQPSPNDDLAHA